jgi:hypothetical protein
MISNPPERFELLIIVINDGYCDRLGQQPQKWPTAREKRRCDGNEHKATRRNRLFGRLVDRRVLIALRSGDTGGFISLFTLFGIVPLTVGWGIGWIFRHGGPPGTASK